MTRIDNLKNIEEIIRELQHRVDRCQEGSIILSSLEAIRLIDEINGILEIAESEEYEEYEEY